MTQATNPLATDVEKQLLKLTTILADHAAAIKELRELVKPATHAPQPVADADVPEQTAAKDKRIGELLESLATANKRIAELSKQLSASQAEVSRLKEACGKTGLAHREAAASNAENDAELTKLREEVARLSSEIIGNLKVIPGAIRVREGGADEDVAKSLAVSVAKLVDENARLTRPVEERAVTLLSQDPIDNSLTPLQRSRIVGVFENAFCRQRNVHEAELDELREFVKDSCLTEEFAAFRAENGQVAK